MDKYYIALNPEKKLTDLINHQKSTVREMVGDQTYLSHPPHFTLFMFTLNSPADIFNGLEKLVENMCKFKVGLENVHVFYNDLSTNANTLTYPVSNKSLEFLKELQSEVINVVDPFNTKSIYKKEDETYKKMSGDEKLNVDLYGCPFVGNNWIPHITIASIEPSKFQVVFDKIRKDPCFGYFFIDSINLYKVGEKSSELIRSFELS
ncbi:2'-5' RNA ligase superfamily protein [uncultured archaeon]|nr:2'-5' RNA ligase superfamily protein [uncultured archaeon]